MFLYIRSVAWKGSLEELPSCFILSLYPSYIMVEHVVFYLALLPIPGPPGLPSGSSLASLELHPTILTTRARRSQETENKRNS